jgi:hypothetical protein
MQCLCASKPIVQTYLNLANDEWVNTACNRRLKDFFIDYGQATGALDPMPYVEEALLLEQKSFEYLKAQDPWVVLKQLFHALTFAQCKVVRERTGRAPDAEVQWSETLLGQLITSVIYNTSASED